MAGRHRLGIAALAAALLASGSASAGIESRQDRLRLLLALDRDAAAGLLSRAEAGESGAMALVGEAYGLAFGGFAQSDSQAARWLSRAASGGQAWALQEARFFSFRAGRGAEIAAAGDALDRAGRVVRGEEAGTGVPDPELARLAASGLPEAQMLLARQLAAGAGVGRDEAAAARWFAAAAGNGVVEAHAELGRMFGSGSGVPLDPRAAAAHYREAAERGSVDGQLALGATYAHGADGTAPDAVEAMKWLALAGARGSDLARGAFAALAEAAGTEAAAEALARAADWEPRLEGYRNPG